MAETALVAVREKKKREGNEHQLPVSFCAHQITDGSPQDSVWQATAGKLQAYVRG